MTITLCLGCGLTAAATVDYDAQIKKYEEQIKKGRAVVKGRVRSDHFEARFFAGDEDARI